MAVEQESSGMDPERIHVPKVRFEIDWIEKKHCIKCDEGGELLVCSDSTCPLAVHEDCIQCSPHYDSNGKFICPYCAYKQVMLAKRKAKKMAMLKEKALSAFLDKRMVDGDTGGLLREKTNITPSTSVDNLCDKVQGDRSEERPDHEYRSVVGVPCNDSKSSAINGKNDVIGKCDQSEKSDVGRDSQREEEIANRFEFEPTSETKALTDLQNKRLVQHLKEMAVIGKRRNLGIESETSTEGTRNDAEIGEENPKTVDDFQNKRVFQQHQEEDVISKRRKLSVESEKSARRTLADESFEEEENPEAVYDFQNKTADQHDQEVAVRENEKLGVEHENFVGEQLDNKEIEEEMPEPEKDANEPSVVENYMEQDDEVASDSPDESHDVVLQSSRCTEKRNHNVKFTNGECTRQPANEVQREKHNAQSKPRQSIPITGFPSFKHYRRPWTAEEEDMLKEGVGKFASKAVKIIPWKKILNYGRHVFHGTRTPENLKDKWRNMTGQREHD